MSVNKVILVGRLGQNPEVRYTAAGAPVATFSLATSENWMDKSGQKQERTEWHRIVVWGKMAETCNQYLSKGRQVYIEGRLQTRQWQDKEGQTKYTTEVQAQTVQFLGSNAGGEQRPSREFGEQPQMGANHPAGASSNQGNQGGYNGGGNEAPYPQQNQPSQPPSPSSNPFVPSFTEDDIPF